ncbi:MAG: hypothetical protein QG630_262 [Patescibacteria group bacterium]|nr:hypothetical protein [Patescibacteria group bacterium]
MKKLITILLSGFLIVSFSNVNAAVTSTSTKTSTTTKKASTQASVVATVNIYSPKTTKINEGEYSISFDIFNRVGIQSNVRYGVELINTENFTVVDTSLANESLTLKEKEIKNLTINYKIPGFVSNGTYKLVIVAKNQNGLPLAYVPADLNKDFTITVKNGSQYLSIDNCMLTVLNDASSTARYKSDQGVDIMPSEKLIATCDVTNKGVGSEKNIKLQLITHKIDSFGDILSNDTLTEMVSVKGNSTQSVSFTIPTLQNPQLYSVDTFFVNSNGQKISPSYSILYSVHGPSATIQNLTMDKASYKKGDVANLKVFWTIGGGGIRISSNKDTYVIKAEIKDSLKNVCGVAAKTTSNPSLAINNTLFNIAITKNCMPAVSTVSIYDGRGNLLDSTEINSQNPVSAVNINAHIPSIANISMLFNGTYRNYAVVFIVVLVLIGYGIVALRKKDEENK